ncbi:phage tail tip lysozyme [Neisseria animalis]|uniref:Phage tail lysozyme domain-containing protein n=1 Tax=Neisseria animalis TaxID=492 RepID=A0A5P3MUP0_NEIAN|nr:phage tail tip lysozyme [Neisseria animalis]QEY24785.1 hypothetical protein D0T90_10165 [Neisseria animalis]ROW31544.1 hypothetical protein CGZ60_09830 [Neisseria animalis]
MAKQNPLMAQTYQAFLNAGLSPQQARAFTAEVGRENDFNATYIFGRHTDANKKRGTITNLGFISWNGSRKRQLENRLAGKGLLNADGTIKRGQAALDEMAKFAVHEINTNPSYKRTKTQFLQNPNVDYHTAKEVLGNNFIRWDYAGNTLGKAVGKHHAKRDRYYAQLGGVIPQGGADYSAGKDMAQAANFIPPDMQTAKAAPVSLESPAAPADDVQAAAPHHETVFERTAKREKSHADMLENMRIKPLEFDRRPSLQEEYSTQLAAAFGEYPDMHSKIPDELDMLIQGIYDEV